MTLYATGVRRAELAHWKVSDIDSQRMVIPVQGGKGRKDRDIMLTEVTGSPAGALARFETKTQGGAVPRQSLAHSRLPDHYQGRLAGLPGSRNAGWFGP
jgi:site-specific recombinase XerD